MKPAAAKARVAGDLLTLALAGILFTSCAAGSTPATVATAPLQTDLWLAWSRDVRPSLILPSLRGRVHRNHASWMKFSGDADPASGFTYVGEEYYKTISQYRTDNRQNGPPVCHTAPASTPEGMVTDRSGTLYTTYYFNSSHLGVATFGPNCGTAGPTFNDPNGAPDDPAVDGDMLYLANLINDGGGATIEVYNLRGGPNPVAQLSDPSVYVGIGIAIDSRHNLFWSYTTGAWTSGQVAEFRGDKMPGIVIVNIGSDVPGGVLLDRSDNLLLIDQTNRSIHIYAPPYGAPPFSTISLKGTAVFCAMGLHEKRLYCLDYEYGSVDVYAYPAGTYIYSYTKGIDAGYDPIGIAIQPSLQPVRPSLDRKVKRVL